MLATWIVLLGACQSDSNVAKAIPNLSVSTEVLDFGGVVVQYGATLDVELLNGGLGGLEIESVTVESAAPEVWSVGSLAGQTVASDERVPLDVTFTPGDYTDYSGTLTIVSNDEESPHVVALVGTGIEAPTPDISLDSLYLDFGTVAPLTTGVLWVTLTNEGDGPLTITGVTQLGSGAFALQSDIDGAVLQPGTSQQVIVSYTPSSDQGDNGGFEIRSDDPDEGTVTVTLIGNGGGDFQYPVAVIDGPASAAPRDTLTYDGSGSYDPAGLEPLTYEWTLTEVPSGSAAGESFVVTTETAYVQTDLAGVYEVSLQVTNSAGLRSAPAVWAVEAIPEEQVHVELVWNNAGDVDLHLLTSEGEFFVDPYDCNFCNRTPSWGGAGTADDPRLDIDDMSGYGPENINIDTPDDDTYPVLVHYFAENGSGDVTVTVRVYLYGELESEVSYALARNEVWTVGEIRWPDGYFIESYDAPVQASRRNCE